jgi:hypothetical protein
MQSSDFNFVVNVEAKSFEIKTPFASTTYDLGIEFEQQIKDKHFLDFLLKVGMNESGSYEWCGKDGDSEMSYYADKKILFIEAYKYFEGGFRLTLDLTNDNAKQMVISELSKLAKTDIEKIYALPDIKTTEELY